MVDAETIEIVAQLAEAFLPPTEMILLHRFPIVGREEPVLAIDREVIRWSSSLSIHVEELRFRPGFDTVPIDTNRQVAFQHNAVVPGKCRNRAELLVQQIL